MAVDLKALSEAPASAGALVPPKYGVGDKCPECGMAMKRLASGEIACPNCGYGVKKAVGFVTEAAEGKGVAWEVKEAAREGVKGLYIRGYASTWAEDRDGDTVARDAFDHSLKDYLADNPVLLLDHKREQVLGEVTKGWTDDTGLGIEAFVPKPEADEERWKITAYRDIKRGLRRALSMGGVFYRAAQKGASKVISKVDLFEISNVAVPSNPKSLFRVMAEKGLSFSEGKADEQGDASSTDDTAANRRAWAKAGYALSDGSFPVLKCGSGFGSVSAAISSMGRGDASNSRLRSHIVKNAKRLGCTDELPEDWKEASGEVKAALLAELKSFEDTQRMLTDALRRKYGTGDGLWTYTLATEADTVAYEVSGGPYSGTWIAGYQIGADGDVTLDEPKRAKVQQVVTTLGGKAAGESDEENGNALKHTHAKVGGGTVTHQHDDATPGHSHEGLLPMPKGKSAAEVISTKCGCATGVSIESAYQAAEDFKAAGNEQALIDYWREQMGGGEGESGDFDDCVEALSKHDEIDDPKALCAWIHMQATGAPPGHAPAEEDKQFPEVDEKGVGTARLHVHVPVGGKAPGKLAMVHSHALAEEADGHRHEGFRPYKHPQGGAQKMAVETGQKSAAEQEAEEAAKKGAKTVTLSEEEFKQFKEARARLEQKETEAKAEALAEQIAQERLDKEAKEAEAKSADERRFANEVAAIVDAKLAAARSGRKYVVPPSGGGSWSPSAAHEQKAGAGMIDLLYRKAQGDPEARSELREMSQKAAAEYGLKALAEGTTSGYLVPPQFMQQGIAEYRIAAAKVRQLCTAIGGIGTNLVYIPRETGIATVGWTAEGAPKPSTDQTFGQLAVNIFTLAGISKVNNQLLEDSSPAVDQIVRKDLGRLLGQAEDIAFLTGTGAGQPTGILNTAGILTGAIGGATLADAIASAISAIQSNYYGDPEAILLHPKHLNTLRTAKDANNRYIFEPAFFPANSPMMRAFMDNNGPGGPGGNLGGGYSNYPSQGGPQGAVWGLPVFSDANLPTPANLGNAIVAAFSEAYVLERTGVTIDVSSEAGTSFEQNQTWFRGEERLGFTAARQPTAFYAITGLP